MFDQLHMDSIKEELHDIKDIKNWNITDNDSSEHRRGTHPGSTEPAVDDYSAIFLNEDISYEEVNMSIRLQKTAGKCSDGDKIHPLLLKRLPKSTLEFVTYLFNSVLKSGKWVWHCSMVSFIRKADKDSYLVPGAYRPITIASYLGKIMERILQNRLILYCQKKDIIDKAQEGFLPQRNTTRYLYKMAASLEEARRRKLSAILLFIDFEKAFDSVHLPSLIVKLNRYGVDGLFLRLIHSFLNARDVSLKVNDYVGPKRTTGLFGLPQGSVLSPLLFIIFVSDLLNSRNLPEELVGKIQSFKYADDGTILAVAESTIECYTVMQKAFDYLSKWCRKWCLVINSNKNKTESIVLQSQDSSTTHIPKLTIGGKGIEYVTKTKVLGVIMDDELKYDHQSKSVLKRCWHEWHRLSNYTTRKKGLNSSTLAILFKTAILTKLMYAAPVWLQKQQKVFNNFMSKVLLKITGAQVHIPKAMAEIVHNIPPLWLSLEIMVVKFCLKSLTQEDEMKAVMLQLEELPNHPYYIHTVWTMKYLADKTEAQSQRFINLLDVSDNDLNYSKLGMKLYQCNKWDKSVINSEIQFFLHKDSIACARNNKTISTFASGNVPLLSKCDKRMNSSDLLDFWHGRSLRFNSFGKTMKRTEVATCEDCLNAEDTSTHKLFECEAMAGSTRDALVEHLGDDYDVSSYKLDVVFGNRKLKTAFREHVRFIIESSCSSDHYTSSQY